MIFCSLRDRPAVRVLAFATAAWLVASGARADRILLRGGGQLRGKVTPDPKNPDRVSVLTEHGKTPLSLQKVRVLKVEPEPSALDGYLSRREEAPATAEGQHELGLWCERNKLPDLAALHYQAALGHDKAFAPARKKLGHTLYNGRWLSGDELREAQGMVRDKGRWVTREEKQRRDQLGEAAAEQANWTRQVRVLREAVVVGPDDRRREAESQLMEIREPAAVAPLMLVLGEDREPVRTLLAHVLGGIPGTEATAALVRRVLDERDPEVRFTAMDELARRKTPEVTKQLVRALRSDSPEVVNRAAWAIANLNAVAAVPSLVGSLLTAKYQVVMAPPAGGSGEGSSISATFGSVPPTPSMGGIPVAYNGSSVGYLTGAVVGPGVAAYGASAASAYPLPNPLATLPGGAGASLAGTGISAGGGVSGSRGPVPRMVGYTVQNVEVLSALVKLTGEDFGYNVNAWRHWVRTSFQPDPTPARRVPQP